MNDIQTLLNNDLGYLSWREDMVIADCLDDLGLNELAKTVNSKTPGQKMEFVSIIQAKARQLQRHDVLERLYFANLIYG